MRITRLEYQKKDPNRVSIYIDGKFSFGVTANDVIKLGLYRDKEVTSEELPKIIAESELGKLLNKAINFISFRPRSEWEIRRKFNNEDLITKLKELRLINDEEFTKWFIEQRQTFRPKGKRLLEAELRKKGIKVKVETGLSETELAKKALEKKKNLDREQKIRFLVSRGFDWQTIEDVLK